MANLLSIDASQTQGAAPGIWRPSVMYGHSTGAMIDLFEGISGGWGLVRLGNPFGPTDWQSATSQGDFITKFTAYLNQSEVTTAIANGTAVLTIEKAPNYLESGTALYQIAKVPSDLSHGGSWELFCKLLCDTARSVLGVLYRAPRNGGGAIEIGQPGLIFEVGNEWGGETAPQLANAKTTYQRLWQGIKASDANAAVMLPGPVIYNRLEASGKTTIREFCEFAGANSCPPDLVGWHSFQGPAALIDLPTDKVSAAQAQVTSDLAAGGLSASTPRVLTEFQSSFLGTDLGTDGHNSRNNYHSASYFAASVWEHWQSGVSGLCMAALLKQNSTPPPSSAPFNETGLGTFAGWGMVTNTTVPVPTAQFTLSKLFSLWDGGSSLGGAALANGVRYFAAVKGDDVVIVLSRWDPAGPPAAALDVLPTYPGKAIPTIRTYRFDATHNSAMANFAAAVGTDTQRQQAAQDAAVAPTSSTSYSLPVSLTLGPIDTVVLRFTFMAKTLQIGLCTDDAGPLPQTLRPGVFNHRNVSGTDDSYDSIIALPNLGMVRDLLYVHLGADHYQALDNFRALFQTNDPRYAAPLRSGARIMVNWTATPLWFQREFSGIHTQGNNLTNTNPYDLDLFEQFMYELAAIPIEAGVDIDRIYWGLFNEPTNGPNPGNVPIANSNFTGTIEDMVRLYAAFAHGIKRRSKNYRVGGIEFGGPASLTYLTQDPGTTDLAMQQFIRLCSRPPQDVYGGNRIPLDFISFHYFIDIPQVTIQYPFALWLTKYGYDPSKVEQILGESNWALGGGGSAGNVPSRMGEVGASAHATRCILAEEAGISFICYALIREGNVDDNAEGFDGQSGLYARVNGGTHNLEWIPTTTRHVLTMQSMLGRRKINFTLSDEARNAGIQAVCTVEGTTRWILLVRDSDRRAGQQLGVGFSLDSDGLPHELFFWKMRQRGYGTYNTFSSPHAYYTGMTADDCNNYILGTYTPRAGLANVIGPSGNPVLTDLAEVKAEILAFKAAWSGDVTITVNVDDPNHVLAITAWQIDDDMTNNPYQAYKQTKAIPANHNTAVAAAITNGTLQTTFTGTKADLPKTFTMGPFSLILLKITANTESNDRSGWTPKPIFDGIEDFLRAR